jgi:mRNA-degrading endonuclease RelE of RelBE toxin-antitoxin system
VGYQVLWNDAALELMRMVKDRRVQRRLFDLADTLAEEPQRRGQPLYDDLTGYWSLHWSRWRVIFSIEEDEKAVHILAVGQRSVGKPTDIYNRARRLLSLGLIESPDSPTQDEDEK